MNNEVVRNWRLRRVAANLRQSDAASLAGLSTTRYAAIERGEVRPTAEDCAFIEKALPALPIQRAPIGSGRPGDHTSFKSLAEALGPILEELDS